jgi:carbon storage regulator
MLVLIRRLGETLKIGDSIAITVMDIRGGEVRIGIDAPREVRVLREELCGKDGESQRRRREQ